MKRSLITLLAICLGLNLLIAQGKLVKGTVYYEETKEPVPFAYVKLKGVAYGTVTEYDGTFSLRIPSKYAEGILEFSYVGLKTFELPLYNYSGLSKIYLETDVTELFTVVISTKRDLNPKSILRKAIKAIPENYVDEPFNLKGYYREYVKENDKPVKYADASFVLDLKPYSDKEAKKKKFEQPANLSGLTTIGSFTSRSSSLHRWHFHQSVLKGEKAEIIESKSSDDLNTTRLYANIQGGPLSALTKDRIKYLKNFMTKFSKYTYTMLEVEKQGEGYYLINFQPAIGAEKMGAKKRPFNNEYKLGGSLLIKKEDLAITEIKYSVPPEYKQYICGYRGWSIRHFDFSVTSKYMKKNGKYVLDYLLHSDEFIVEDTATDRRIPYAAISEFYTYDTKVGEEKKAVPPSENFANSDYNFLFDYPEGYNTPFWAKHETEHAESKVPEEILVAMSEETPLIKQFAYKLVRDTTLKPPVAKKEPETIDIHGQKLVDNYAWMKDTKNPMGNEEVMSYLAKENGYTNNYLKPLKPLQREIFKELKSYIDEDYESLPSKEGGYEYFLKYAPEQEYPNYYRKKVGEESKELLFDLNQMAEDHGYFNFGGLSVNPSGKIAAYSINTTGNDKWDVHFKNLDDNQTLPRKIEYTSGLVWLTDSTILYTKVEQPTFRSSKIYRFNIFSGVETMIYEERDKAFSVGVSKSRSKQFAFINIYGKDENEVRFLHLTNPYGKFRIISPRKAEHRYSVAHFEDKFYVVTNDQAENNRIMTVDTSKFEKKYWEEVVPTSKEVQILSILPFKKWMVYHERHGLDYKIKVVNRLDGKSHYIKQMKNQAVYLGENNEFDTDTLQISKASYNRPLTILDYDMEEKKFKRLKSVGKFSPAWFSTVEVVYAEAKDGTEIPITLIYNKRLVKNLRKAGKNPTLFITGYGSYGSGNSPGYMPNIAPLLQKGFVYAIAHVRGGGELGDNWYKEGKMLKKKNTFTDFISCTEHLIAEGFGEKGKVIAEGGSAGGLLMGAITNSRPDLFKLVILDVPFVDVVNTMLDEKLPLTRQEYSEWGNPNEKKYFKYIKSYSPYDNVEEQAYPNMLFLTAINDSRVGYWEPAKMVAKLRSMKTDENKIFLRTDFSAGHGGASGRYASLAETTLKYALILDLLKNDN
ncbi:prolyl oligopeptidase family serine peptidase [Ekhidna sp.]|uniref:prolyl oligopeptidase family serine peptidase n=1 Tax=Ekhidna sp. TaxID=2608089 RepID=UPI003BA9A05C